jgi:P-type conjugative transfer protein TrbJ
MTHHHSNRNHLSRFKAALAGASCLALITWAQPASALIVFDPKNYVENLLSAARALEQIENQVKQLQNEAQMILKMDLNLEQLGSSVAGDLQSSMNGIKELIDKADGIAMSVTETQSETKRLFPSEYASALSNDDSLKLASERWTETLDAFKRSMALEAKVTEATATDSTVLSDLLTKSSSSIGNLQVQQAGNELLGLSVKQQLQLQNLLASGERAQHLDRARAMAEQEEARLRFKTFLGDGTAYTR